MWKNGKFGYAQEHRPSPNGEGKEGEVERRAELLNVEECDATAVEKNSGSRLPRINYRRTNF
jgi:hypothetical protein